MTSAAWVALLAAAVLAVTDWRAVARGPAGKPVEYVCKPGVMVALIAVALAVHPAVDGRRPWIVLALLLCLAGDVFLMLPADLFVAGLAAFLLGHLAYTVAFHVHGGSPRATLVAALVVLLLDVGAGPPIVRAVRDRSPDLLVPVLAYVVVISAMATSALASGSALAGAGALRFLESDGTLAWNRFVQPFRLAPLAVIVTYHLAQAGLVLSLIG